MVQEMKTHYWRPATVRDVDLKTPKRARFRNCGNEWIDCDEAGNQMKLVGVLGGNGTVWAAMIDDDWRFHLDGCYSIDWYDECEVIATEGERDV